MIMAPMEVAETVDEVLRETRRIKVALAAALDFNVDRILQDAKEKQANSGREILSPPVRKNA